MLSEHHESDLLAKNECINIHTIREKLTAIKAHRVDLEQQSENWFDLQKCAKTIPSWEFGVALCVIQINKIKQQQEQSFQLRGLQLVPIILYFECKDANNIFFEVLTGEGKTMIIAIIAAVNVLLGHKVDIITTTDVLAEANNNEMKVFYEAFNIKSTTNRNSDANTYDSDIVYGTMFHFGKDYLKDCLAKNPCGLPARLRPPDNEKRSAALCLVDEVDLLAIDSADQSVKVAKPFPGMEMMDDIYRAIFGRTEDSTAKFESCLQRLPKLLQEYCNFMKPTWDEHQRTNYRLHFNKYIKERNKVIPIDPQSGMIMHGGVFSNGLQQLLEVNRKCPITPAILNAITLSNYGYIQMYHKLCGLTATLGDHREMKLLKKVFCGAEYYRIPAFCESKRKELTKRLNNIMYKSKDTNNILHQCQSDGFNFLKMPFTKEKKNDSFVYCACEYEDNQFTQDLIDLNGAMTGYSYPDRTKYIELLKNKIMSLLKKNKGRKIILLNLKVDLSDKCIANDGKCVNLKDLSKLPNYFNDVKLYIFDIKFDTESVLNNGTILMNAACDLINIEHIIEGCLMQKRSLLIICRNRGVLSNIRRHISSSHEDKIIQYIGFADEGSSVIDTINPIGPRKIILTTLIGSRGTDYQITDELNDNGGLHVVCTFIPRNKRIHQQIFGRAARNGRSGSAQICPINVHGDIDAALAQRHETYLKELEENEVKFREMLFFHNLHEKFREFIRELGNTTNEIRDAEITTIMIEDLTEYWAFWLKYNEKKIDVARKPDEILQTFKNESQHIVTLTGYHNPVYAAQRANYYFSQGNHEQASEIIKPTLQDDGFSRALILEYLNFVRFAILEGNERQQAKELLNRVKDNQFEIQVDKYIDVLDNQTEVFQCVRDTIESKALTQFKAMLPKSILSLVDSVSDATKDLEPTQQETEIKDIELALKRTINCELETHCRDPPIVISDDKLRDIFDEWENLYGNDNNPSIMSSITKRWHFTKFFNGTKIEEIMSKINDRVEHLCMMIEKHNNEALEQTTHSHLSIDDLKLLFEYIPNRFMDRVHNNIHTQFEINQNVVRGC